MTKREQAKLDNATRALRELVCYASALPCADANAPAFVAVSNALDVLRDLDATPAPVAKRSRKAPIVRQPLPEDGASADADTWGMPLARDVENRTWTRAKLVIRSGGHTQCPVTWRETRTAEAA